jgi:hypothetical protein
MMLVIVAVAFALALGRLIGATGPLWAIGTIWGVSLDRRRKHPTILRATLGGTVGACLGGVVTVLLNPIHRTYPGIYLPFIMIDRAILGGISGTLAGLVFSKKWPRVSLRSPPAQEPN